MKQNGIVLAVDTATEACSAALRVDGVVHRRFEIAPRRHNTLIFEMCESLFEETGSGLEQLHALVFGRGPGAFTGVRVAAAMAQGVACARGLSVVPISDLRAVAQSALERHRADAVLVAMDARIGEVYYGCYRKNAAGLAEAVGGEGLAAPQAMQVPDAFEGVGAGSAWSVHREALMQRFERRLSGCDAELLPDAAVMLQLALPEIQAGRMVEPAQALPVYLRNRVVKTL